LPGVNVEIVIEVPVPKLVLDEPVEYQFTVPVPLTLREAAFPLHRVCWETGVVLTGLGPALQIRVIHTFPSPEFIPETLIGFIPEL
jgi:hypothetical protein